MRWLYNRVANLRVFRRKVCGALHVSAVLPIRHCAIYFKKEKTMATKIFVNLPVKNLNKSIAFFTQLGFT
ncbi:MAG: hypothetical protein ACXW1Z_05235, partial [Methylobacter sp.]